MDGRANYICELDSSKLYTYICRVPNPGILGDVSVEDNQIHDDQEQSKVERGGYNFEKD